MTERTQKWSSLMTILTMIIRSRKRGDDDLDINDDRRNQKLSALMTTRRMLSRYVNGDKGTHKICLLFELQREKIFLGP